MVCSAGCCFFALLKGLLKMVLLKCYGLANALLLVSLSFALVLLKHALACTAMVCYIQTCLLDI